MIRYLLLLILLLPVLLGGCGDDDDSPFTETIPSLSPEEIIAQASPKLDELSSFHFDLTQKGGGTRIAKGVEMTAARGDIAPPDKLYMEIDGSAAGQFVEVKVITLGTNTYMTVPLIGTWELLSGDNDFNAVTLFQPSTGIKAVMEGTTDLSRINEEKVDGTLCFHLKGMIFSEALNDIAAGHAAEGLPVEVDIWIGVSDFRLRRVVFDGQIHEDENEGIVRTLEFSAFNQPVDIESPV